jgi:hypothetical protein
VWRFVGNGAIQPRALTSTGFLYVFNSSCVVLHHLQALRMAASTEGDGPSLIADDAGVSALMALIGG